MNKVTNLYEPPNIVGAVRFGNKVVVEGRQIPKLSCVTLDNGDIELYLDDRFSSVFPKEYAHLAAWLIAHALAIGEGYSHLGAENKDKCFAPKVIDGSEK